MRKTVASVAASFALAPLFLSPASAADNWTGSMRCEINSAAPGYSYQETQTWTLTGAAPVKQGSHMAYPATWNVNGSGSHDRTRDGVRRVSQWGAVVPGIQAPISFMVTPFGRLEVQLWHAQLTEREGYKGTDQFIRNGVPDPAGKLAATVYEWQPKKIDVAATETQIAGSYTVEAKTQLGPLQPSDAVPKVTCTWSFGKGSAPALPPGNLVPPTTTGPAAPTLGVIPLDPSLLPKPELCTLRGPEAESTGSHATPISARLFWKTVGGATGYTVSRDDLGLLTSTPLASPTTSYMHRVGLPHPGTYVYTVTARYPNGCGATRISLNATVPATPNLSYELGSQPGQVRLKWPANGTDKFNMDFSGAVVTGPTLPPAGREVRRILYSGEHLDLDGVPAGTQTWTVKAYWDVPGGGRIMDKTGKSITVQVP